MTNTTQSHPVPRLSPGAFPAQFADGGVYLLASAGDPASVGVDLDALGAIGTPDETAFVVTTTRSASTTLDELDERYAQSARPALGFVDTTSEHQSVSSLFEGTPTIFTPAPGDLERMVLALAELTDRFPPGAARRHLVVRSLTPILETTAVDRVCHVLERIAGLRSDSGLCLLGIDYTRHDPATMDALSSVVDGILWLSDTDGLELDFQPTRSPGSYTGPPSVDEDT